MSKRRKLMSTGTRHAKAIIDLKILRKTIRITISRAARIDTSLLKHVSISPGQNISRTSSGRSSTNGKVHPNRDNRRGRRRGMGTSPNTSANLTGARGAGSGGGGREKFAGIPVELACH
eukprot:4077019-Karenia_brevis.AAC.1